MPLLTIPQFLRRSCVSRTPRSTREETRQWDLILVELGEAWTAFMGAVCKSPARTDYTSLRQWHTLHDILRKMLRNLTGTRRFADIDAVVSAVMYDMSLAPENVPLRTIVARLQTFAGVHAGSAAKGER